MSNQDIIEKLTTGRNAVEEITLTNSVTVTLRPLTSGELTQLRNIEQQPFKMKFKMNQNGKIDDVKKEDITKELGKQTMDVGMAEFTNSQAETMYAAVAWSMDLPVDVVKTFDAGVPEEIFRHVMRISNLPDLEVVKQFRKQ